MANRYGNRIIPGGGTGKNSAWLFRREGKYSESMKLEDGKSKAFKTQSRETALQSGKSAKDFGTEGNIAGEQTGTSIFDPVLCELAYRWFCPPGGTVLDPFAGGSVRGIVAAILGYSYTGIELRQEQIGANERQADTILEEGTRKPEWKQGDSQQAASLCPEVEADFVFSCPPYYDLEVYSELPEDLSQYSDYGSFLAAYEQCIAASVGLLKDNRFACFVVGDMRDKAGYYRHFVTDTILAFEKAGMGLYNEAILVTALGSLPIRVGIPFEKYRKLGKTHQNVLVFYKGDPANIPIHFPILEISDPAEGFGEIA